MLHNFFKTFYYKSEILKAIITGKKRSFGNSTRIFESLGAQILGICIY
jgi:hypothetical protein